MTTTTIEKSTIEQIPHIRLQPSPLNPRRHFDQAKLEELAASIAAQGILQNLVARMVTTERGGGGIAYEIAAGERRWRAVQLLIEKGEVAPDYRVPCRIVPLTDRELVELAVAENSQRADVTPLEEADGFAKLIELGADVAEVAARFGRPERFVRQRLALHQLVPDARAALEEGKMTLATAQAFANAPRRIQQVALENSGRSYDGTITTYVLERIMRDDTFPVDKALFDPAEYDGDIIEDLFGSQPPRFADAQQARLLQRQAIDVIAQRYRDAGHEDVEVLTPAGYWSPWDDRRVKSVTEIFERKMPSDEEIRTELAGAYWLEGEDEEEIRAHIEEHRERIAEEIQATEDALAAKQPIRIVVSENLLSIRTWALTMWPEQAEAQREEAEKPKYAQAFLDSLQGVRTEALRRAILDKEADARPIIDSLLIADYLSSYMQELKISGSYHSGTKASEHHLSELTFLLQELAKHAPTEAGRKLIEPVEAPYRYWPHHHNAELEIYRAALAAPQALRDHLVVICLTSNLEAPKGRSGLGTTPLAAQVADDAGLDPAKHLAPLVTEPDVKRLGVDQLKAILEDAGKPGRGKKKDLVAAVLDLAAEEKQVPREWLLEEPA